MPLTAELETLLGLVPGSRLVEDFTVPDDPDTPYPTPYGDNPPMEWFTEPHHDVVPGATGLITADGRFCAYSHEWDRCHNGYTSSGECWMPPRSVTQNRYFHQSTIVTAEGVQIPTGVVPLGDGHAPLDVDVYTAMAHYDKPERVHVRARIVETEHGAVVCGAIVPGTTHRQVAQMRAAALSGDWRWVPELGAMEFLGPCFVARPGLPLGLEHAALEQALWDLTRSMDVTRTASGDVRAVVGGVVRWAPRAPLTSNVKANVLAAALPREAPMSDCSCKTPDPTVDAQPVVRRARTAAAGTMFTYRELNDAIQEAVKNQFAPGESSYAWVKDWDDNWVVFSVEIDDAVTGYVERNLMVSMTIAQDGTIGLDPGSAVEVLTTFIPAPGETRALPITAHASDTNAIASLAAQIEQMSNVVDGLAGDVARMSAEQLEPADLVAELPPAPA